MTVELVWETDELLVVKYSGEVDGEQAYSSLVELGGDIRFDRLRGIIGDGSGIIKNIANDHDIERMASATKALSKSNPNIRNAVIMGPVDDAQTLIAYYQFLSEEVEWEIEVFKTEYEARAWINQ